VGGAIEGAEAVNKSFPGYWETLKELNVKVELYGVDQQ
jgi:5-enolpyruvylshikimate-3-phosphate synthase